MRGVDMLALSTEEDLVRAIVRFANLRQRRRRTILAMSFIWPPMLIFLLLIPLFVLLYLRMQRRRRQLVAGYGGLMVTSGAGRALVGGSPSPAAADLPDRAGHPHHCAGPATGRHQCAAHRRHGDSGV